MSLSQAGPADRRSGRDYHRLLRGALLWCAVLLAVLPIPITWLRLLPAYETHARFLAFYAPVVCLLLLGYLLYVRDALARLMFANILNPLPDPDPYYRMGAAEAIQRRLRQAQAAILALLPAALLAASFYCLVRYTDRLRFSVTAASAAAPQLPFAGEEVGRVSDDSAREPAAAARARDSVRRPSPAAIAESAAVPVEPVISPARDRVLRTAGIDAIPLFTELTVLYIGIFASALLAVILMALKEHAKDAMGLSEQELMVGRYAYAEDPLHQPQLAPPRTE